MASDDNLYPRNGAHRILEPADQAEARAVEEALANKYATFIQERIEYLQERIAFYGDVDAIPIDIDREPEAHQRIIAINRGMKAELSVELDELIDLADKHGQ